MNFYSSIGIKQVIRYEWMQHTVELLKSGLDKKEIRGALERYLSTKTGSGKTAGRAEYTMSLAVSLLMNIWVTPNPALLTFRNTLLEMTTNKAAEPVCHWAMFAASYPFWFNMSFILGSLFRIQDQIKKSQVLARMYAILGERNTVERCSRYVIRSFVAWDIIKDKERAGYYEKGNMWQISDPFMTSLLIESMLHAVPERHLPLTDILNCPAFFCMKLPLVNSFQFEKINDRLVVERFSVSDDYINLR
jgi:hypothetical protein